MIEQVILSQLVFNDSYTRKVLPFIKPEYFHDPGQKATFSIIEDFVTKYNRLPTREALMIELDEAEGYPQKTYESALETIKTLATENSDEKWLLDTTEKFCQDKAIHNAIMEVVDIYDGKNGALQRSAIPKVLQDALGVSFDTNIGHDYFKDSKERFDSYHAFEEKMDFDIDVLNRITNGGVERKTLNVLLAGVHVGKTLFKCHLAAAYLKAGKNVLYISMEMGERQIAERIDANLLDISLNEMRSFPEDMYLRKVARLRGLTPGNLIVKQFPTGAANAGHFRHLINELKLKKNFFPDVVFIDYLNICASARMKLGNVNSYTLIKSVAEELRGLAIEQDVPIWTSTQVNRQGFTDSDPGMESVSESFGIPATSDLMLALVNTEELQEQGMVMCKQLKNRYKDMWFLPKFTLGISRDKMRIFDVVQNEENVLGSTKSKTDDGDVPFFDKTTFGEADKGKEKKKYGKFIT